MKISPIFVAYHANDPCSKWFQQFFHSHFFIFIQSETKRIVETVPSIVYSSTSIYMNEHLGGGRKPKTNSLHDCYTKVLAIFLSILMIVLENSTRVNAKDNQCKENQDHEYWRTIAQFLTCISSFTREISQLTRIFSAGIHLIKRFFVKQPVQLCKHTHF